VGQVERASPDAHAHTRTPHTHTHGHHSRRCCVRTQNDQGVAERVRRRQTGVLLDHAQRAQVRGHLPPAAQIAPGALLFNRPLERRLRSFGCLADPSLFLRSIARWWVLQVSGSQDKTVALWDLEAGKQVQSFVGHTHSVEGTLVPTYCLVANHTLCDSMPNIYIWYIYVYNM
jgi:hypothetical protein